MNIPDNSFEKPHGHVLWLTRKCDIPWYDLSSKTIITIYTAIITMTILIINKIKKRKTK